MKNQRGAIPSKIHEEKKRQAKARRSKKRGSARPRRGFIMDGDNVSHRGGCVHNMPHVAEYYRNVIGHPDVAANLVRELKPWAQKAVLGSVVQ